MRALKLAFHSLLLALTACGSDDTASSNEPASCTKNPKVCGADETCWVVDASGKYDCLTATTDHPQGAACQNTLGRAQCNAGMQCVPGAQGSATGTCQPFCDEGSCPIGLACVGLYLTGVTNPETIYVCAPTGGGTGGAGGTAGSSGSGGTAGTTATGGTAGTTATGGTAGTTATGGTAGAAGTATTGGAAGTGAVDAGAD